MRLKILFSDGTEKVFTIIRGESIPKLIADVCKWNRRDITEVEDYWITK